MVVKSQVFSDDFTGIKKQKQMVNFNFGLGGNNSQTSDPVTTQDDSATTDETNVAPDAIEVPTAEAKPLTELMKEDAPQEVVSTEKMIPEPITEAKPVEAVASPEVAPIVEEKTEEIIKPEVKVETPVVEEPKVEAPVAPVTLPVKEEKPEQVTKPVNDTPKEVKTEAPVNPFTTPVPTAVTKKEEPVKTEAPTNPFVAPVAPVAPVVPTTNNKKEETKPVASVNPFAAPEEKKEIDKSKALVTPFTAATQKKEEVKKEEAKTEPTPPVRETMPLFEEEAETETPVVTEGNDAMKTISRVKNEIESSVKFHKTNIQILQKDIVNIKNKAQEEVANREKKIQKEKQLLRDTGNSYSKMLKELQDLTQLFGTSQPQNGNKPKHHGQSRRPENRK